MFNQVFEMVDIGLVILDKELRVRFWNHWMQIHSGLTPEKIIGSPVCDVFPNLRRPRFLNSCRAVFAFGNFCFFSQKLHHYLFPFDPVSAFDSDFKQMQQSCTMGPLRNDRGEITHLFIAVQDVTPDLARQLGISRNSVIVTDVESGSPADEAGIQPQDVIVQVNRVKISSVRDFEQEMAKAAQKKSVSLLLKRGRASFFVTLRSE